MQEESPEGGRFKKEVVVDGQSYLLLIRDEGGPPELQVNRLHHTKINELHFGPHSFCYKLLAFLMIITYRFQLQMSMFFVILTYK